MKKIVAIILVLCAFCFTGCGKIMAFKQEVEDVTELTNKFSSALSSGDPEEVKECVHPDAKIDQDKILETVEEFEAANDVDFSQGVTLESVGDLERRTDSELGGNTYNVTCELNVGGVPVEVLIVVVNNDNGCGIYDFEIVE